MDRTPAGSLAKGFQLAYPRRCSVHSSQGRVYAPTITQSCIKRAMFEGEYPKKRGPGRRKFIDGGLFGALTGAGRGIEAGACRFRGPGGPVTNTIDIQNHFIREHVDSGKIPLGYFSTNEMTADIFTKAMPQPAFTKHNLGLGLTDQSVLLLKNTEPHQGNPDMGAPARGGLLDHRSSPYYATNNPTT